MTGVWSYLLIALFSAAGGFLSGYNLAGKRTAVLEARIFATEAAILRQSEMIERLIAGLTNVMVIAEAAEPSDTMRSIARLTHTALNG